MYAQKFEGDSWLGERLDGGKIDKMSGMGLISSRISVGVGLMRFVDQQLGQLYELMQAIQNKERGGDDDL